ncbi:hypothetical protein EW146_g5612 [Bondarzewia mesenterica]|uniref:Sugar phosphate transporter domain-containing protein n=1 Tax=Bondarzewia mesenterica TaxID=1095465 RepID=A0A4V3XES7_9AGAM|nr:hypothetical protein EW146_g5612 [Bondarzewia mesenterica]
MPPNGLPIWASPHADSAQAYSPMACLRRQKRRHSARTLKMHGVGGGARDWLAGARKDVLPSHTTVVKKGDDDKGWKDTSRISSAKDGLVADFKKNLHRVIPSSDILPLTSNPPAGPARGLRSPMSSISLPSSGLPLPSPETFRFILLCGLWYTSSALSSNTGKSIMNQFKYPVTLTFIQFGFVAGYCLLFMSPLVRFSTLRRPTRSILKDTFPMGLFQVGGHIFSSMAISRIPVSTVHTIKVCLTVMRALEYG